MTRTVNLFIVVALKFFELGFLLSLVIKLTIDIIKFIELDKDWRNNPEYVCD